MSRVQMNSSLLKEAGQGEWPTGFNTPQIDLMILGNHEKSSEEDWVDIIEDNTPPVSKLGDIWSLGNHKILCGNSLELDSYSKLLGEDRADIIFTDPPYNVPINGHVLTQSGKSSHDEFAMASGEMSAEAFQTFLRTISERMVRFSKDGSIHFICMDWRHIYDLLHAAGPIRQFGKREAL